MSGPALWLTLRELGARRRRAALAALVVAAAAAAATAMELVARAREDVVAVQIDAMGPALTLAAPGVTAGALARRELGEAVLSSGVEPAARAALGRDLRALERRLVLRREVAGVEALVIGVDPGVLPGGAAAPGSVAIGSELARRLGQAPTVEVAGRRLRAWGVLPSTASADDLAVVMPLQEVHALTGVQGANELRIFLRPGVSPRDAEERLSRAGLGAAVVRTDRGEVADADVQGSLARHRAVAYVVIAAVAGLCLLIATHLDAAERRVELATLVAIGASRSTVLAALVSRSALVAGAGGVLGVAGGAALALAQDPAVVAALAGARGVAAATIAAAVGIGAMAAAPTALGAALRDPVRDLQES